MAETSTCWPRPLRWALTECNERRRSGVAGGLQEALGYARDSHRRAVLVTAGVKEPAAGNGREIRACPSAARTGRAERRHGRMDDGGIDGGELVIAETQCRHVADRRVLDERVRAPHELQQSLPTLRSAQVGCDAALALVVGPVAQRAFQVRLVVDKWTQMAAAHAAGRLDSNHLSSQAGKQVARELADSLAEIQNPVVLQHRVIHPSSAPARSAARCRFFPVRAIHANPRQSEPPNGVPNGMTTGLQWPARARCCCAYASSHGGPSRRAASQLDSSRANSPLATVERAVPSRRWHLPTTTRRWDGGC